MTATTGTPGLFIPAFPALRPTMAIPRMARPTLPFPLNQPSLLYYYLARNGIYALVEAWNLRDQEVLFPAYFHGVEVETLRAAGVKLRFYPVHSAMDVDVDEIRAALTPQTRAIYLIHYLGFPGPVEEVARLCAERGIRLIEDCALSLLSCLGARPLGSFGDASIFCLYKTLPLPHGGALRVRDAGGISWPRTRYPPLTSTMAYTATAVWRNLKMNGGGRMHRLLSAARKSARAVSGKVGVVPVGGQDFDPTKVDLRMSRLCHWLAGRQDYQAIVEKRRWNFAYLQDRLGEVSKPVFEHLPAGVCPLFYPLRTRNKERVLERLFAGGVEGINFWSRTPDIISPGAFPEVDALRQTLLELPCHQDLGPSEMRHVADSVLAQRADI